MYTIPNEFFFRIHHVRPRFKNDVDSVLLFMAQEISSIPPLPKQEFAQILNSKIYAYPGNAERAEKTINNWRTEISALFGFVITDENHISKASNRAIELAESEDVVQAFKKFLFTFQYPGHHIKPQEIAKMIEAGIKFKPAKSILNVFLSAEKEEGKHVFLTKAEVCHCIFNDLRCTRDNEDPSDTWKRIKHNRNNGVIYDTTGDVIRYAGDIIDYMVLANLLKTYNGQEFYLNSLENESILKFANSNEWFDKYDEMIDCRSCDMSELSDIEEDWFLYVNQSMESTDFATDITSLVSSQDENEPEKLTEGINEFLNKISRSTVTTKETGDLGEALVYSHEVAKLKNNGREDLIHLVKRIPTQLAVGYDISSIEIDGIRKRYIEVKTTISQRKLVFSRVCLTANEWRAATTNRQSYFVYRLLISSEGADLFIMQDPVGLYKQDVIEAVPTDGIELSFNTNTAGKYEDLLAWTK